MMPGYSAMTMSLRQGQPEILPVFSISLLTLAEVRDLPGEREQGGGFNIR